MKTTGFATIGTSKITEKFLSAAKEYPEFKYVAVYSRSRKKAEEFAAAHGAVRAYDNLDEITSDPEVDAVYIGSPNYMHYEQALKFLNARKHVLCEKSIASDYKQAEKMFKTARENKCILLEAVRTIFDPGMEIIQSNLYKVGAIRKATFVYCQYSSRYDSFKKGKSHNIFSRKCSAGALMDIGVYSIHTMLHLLGKPDKISGFSVMLRGEIDGAGTILAKYSDKIAEVSYSKITDSLLPNEIQGEDGVIQFWGNINSPENVQILFRNGTKEILYHRETNNEMKYELEHFLRMIQDKETAEPHEQRSLNAMQLMDEMRQQCNIIFPTDPNITQEVPYAKHEF